MTEGNHGSLPKMLNMLLMMMMMMMECILLQQAIHLMIRENVMKVS